MKRFHIFSTLFSLALMLLLTGCDSEKEFNLIEGSLPIKTSTLYVVGDATPTGWNIDAPTPLTPSADDELVFTYEGVLYKGEIKLCLTPGSWDAPFIRPVTDQTAINKSGIAPTTFDMHAGDPDNKWRVTEAGEYKLTFDMRNWTMAAEFIKELDGPTIVPIETDAFYIVGDATPAGWNIDAPYALTKTDAFTFVY